MRKKLKKRYLQASVTDQVEASSEESIKVLTYKLSHDMSVKTFETFVASSHGLDSLDSNPFCLLALHACGDLTPSKFERKETFFDFLGKLKNIHSLINLNLNLNLFSLSQSYSETLCKLSFCSCFSLCWLLLSSFRRRFEW
jgi:hypothetical protein